MNDKVDIKLLLEAGAHINKYNCKGQNAINCNLEFASKASVEVAMPLFAAGEKLDGTIAAFVKEFTTNNDITYGTLKFLCGETIRNHLININPRLHLFYRVAELGLPSLLVQYLLHNISLKTFKEMWCDITIINSRVQFH